MRDGDFRHLARAAPAHRWRGMACPPSAIAHHHVGWHQAHAVNAFDPRARAASLSAIRPISHSSRRRCCPAAPLQSARSSAESTVAARTRRQMPPASSRNPGGKVGHTPHQRIVGKRRQAGAPIVAEIGVARLEASVVETVRHVEEAVAPARRPEQQPPLRPDAGEVAGQEAASVLARPRSRSRPAITLPAVSSRAASNSSMRSMRDGKRAEVVPRFARSRRPSHGRWRRAARD